MTNKLYKNSDILKNHREELINDKKVDKFKIILNTEFNQSYGSPFKEDEMIKDKHYKLDYDKMKIKLDNLERMFNNKIIEIEKIKKEIQKENYKIEEMKNQFEILLNVETVNNFSVLKDIKTKTTFLSNENNSIDEKNLQEEELYKKENNELKKKILNFELNFEKALKIKLENEVKKVKEYYENQNKEHLLKSNIKIRNLIKENDELKYNLNNNYIEKNKAEKEYKEYQLEIEKLCKELHDLKNFHKYFDGSGHQKHPLNDKSNCEYLSKNSEIENLLKTSYVNEIQQSEIFLKADYDTQIYYATEENEEPKINFHGPNEIVVKACNPTFFARNSNDAKI